VAFIFAMGLDAEKDKNGEPAFNGLATFFYAVGADERT
jgi:hypothetical protein